MDNILMKINFSNLQCCSRNINVAIFFNLISIFFIDYNLQIIIPADETNLSTSHTIELSE